MNIFEAEKKKNIIQTSNIYDFDGFYRENLKNTSGDIILSPDATIEDKLGTKMRKTYAKKRKYGSQNSLFSIYISHFLSENYRF